MACLQSMQANYGFLIEKPSLYFFIDCMGVKPHLTANFVQKFAKKYSRLVGDVTFQGESDLQLIAVDTCQRQKHDPNYKFGFFFCSWHFGLTAAVGRGVKWGRFLMPFGSNILDLIVFNLTLVGAKTDKNRPSGDWYSDSKRKKWVFSIFSDFFRGWVDFFRG